MGWGWVGGWVRAELDLDVPDVARAVAARVEGQDDLRLFPLEIEGLRGSGGERTAAERCRGKRV